MKGQGMSRALELDEMQRVAPRLPEEPVPSFTQQFHDSVGQCAKNHSFSYPSSLRMRVKMHCDGYQETLDDFCPHCARTKWRNDYDQAELAQREIEAEERAREGQWTPRKSRKVAV
jgi:hypothetical protein